MMQLLAQSLQHDLFFATVFALIFFFRLMASKGCSILSGLCGFLTSLSALSTALTACLFSLRRAGRYCTTGMLLLADSDAA
jgi:hypothetical protein